MTSLPKHLQPAELHQSLDAIKNKLTSPQDNTVLKNIFNCIDLTSLNATDSAKSIKLFVEKVNWFETEFDMKNVAAICVYPLHISTVKSNLIVSNVNIASVSACFPSSQTFLSVKIAECELAANKGADELDIVLSLGHFFDYDFQYITNEISLIKSVIGKKHLKVILETGELKTVENIYTASHLAMEAGADFIKTSTGKTPVSASPEAVYTMCAAIAEFYAATGKMVGIKPSGGIVTTADSLLYYNIVKSVLGAKWLNNKYFRLGASRLSNNLLSDIYQKEIKHF
ncbi:MAG TPA: deoxyribose-phosphate aldolase [Bacteroidales bacterium]|nr:deoxyribose-phosphate aldolase [Bacteroidales bacterium]HQL69345.1 deoxyribose-phosphate aldolase [Bacteroidales bacterium]